MLLIVGAAVLHLLVSFISIVHALAQHLCASVDVHQSVGNEQLPWSPDYIVLKLEC